MSPFVLSCFYPTIFHNLHQVSVDKIQIFVKNRCVVQYGPVRLPLCMAVPAPRRQLWQKRWGPRRSPPFLQSCLYIKDTQTKFSSPDQSGRHSACYYYSIMQCYPRILHYFQWNALGICCIFMQFAFAISSRNRFASSFFRVFFIGYSYWIPA